ncbi:family 16 glycosylhydrolase [Falsiroseomonas sp. HW251]|uniref:family 16 glycosylhydrolase n=1 Tax=Falsiroseomonas sp. HW251 TaxID=3390998 RepID=UPI003D313A62
MAANDPLHITFDNGDFGSIGNIFNVNTSVPGQVTLGPSGSAMMEWAVGPDAGHGYGTYTVVAKLDGGTEGAGIVFWPADNSWPGQEIDLVEMMPDGSGRQYGTLHWNAGGSDAYESRIFDGVYGGSWHEYQMVWEPGKITMSVDGQVKTAFTDHVPADYAHGGMNNTIGALNLKDYTSISIADVRYDPLYAAAPAPTPAATVSAIAADVVHDAATTTDVANDAATTLAAAADVIDWNALAALATANYEATGSWFV